MGLPVGFQADCFGEGPEGKSKERLRGQRALYFVCKGVVKSGDWTRMIDAGASGGHLEAWTTRPQGFTRSRGESQK